MTSKFLVEKLGWREGSGGLWYESSKVPKFTLFFRIVSNGSEWQNNGKQSIKTAQIDFGIFGRETRLEERVSRNMSRKFQSSHYSSDSFPTVQHGKIL